MKPLFSSEAECKAIDMKMIFCSWENETQYHNKSFALLIPSFSK